MILLLIVLRYSMKWAWVIVSNPVYLCLWILISLGPFLYVRRKTNYLKVSSDLEKKYDAFYRTDMEKRNNFRFYLIYILSFIPRYIIAWIAILTYCSLIMIFMIGTNENKPMEPWRYKLVSVTIKPFVRLHLWVSGVTKINYKLK